MAKKPSTAICYTIAIVLTACLASLSAGHWIIQLEGEPNWIIAVAVLGSVCVSLLVAVCAYLAGRGFSKVLLVPAALVFIGADTYQNGLGYQTFTGLTVSGEVEAAQSRLSNAQARASEVTLKREVCICPQTKAENRRTFETETKAANDAVLLAKSELAKLNTPKASIETVAVAMLAIQLALAGLFAALGRGSIRATEVVQSETQAPNVVRFPRPQMDAKDQRTWAKIAKA